MPGPYGSVANPVVLDPYRRIVEVHWNPVRWMAVPFDIERSSTNAFQQHMVDRQYWDWTALEIGDEEPDEFGGWGTYVTRFRYIFGARGVNFVAPYVHGSPDSTENGLWTAVEDGEDDALTGFVEWKAETWSGATQPTDITGLPDLPETVDFTPRTVWNSSRGGFADVAPQLSWDEPSGSSIAEAPPTPAGGTWKASSLVTVHVKGISMTANGKGADLGSIYLPPFYEYGGGFIAGHDTEVTVGIDISGRGISADGTYPSTLHSRNFSVGDIGWRAHNRTYQVVGVAMVPGTRAPGSLVPFSPGRIWLLGEREDTTT